MFLSVILSAISRWLRSRETARELARLSDHQLSDIGISRSQIASIARQAR